MDIFPKNNMVARVAVMLIGVIILTIGLFGFIDRFVFDNVFSLNDWGYDTRMALPTTVAFILTGKALVIIAASNQCWITGRIKADVFNA